VIKTTPQSQFHISVAMLQSDFVALTWLMTVVAALGCYFDFATEAEVEKVVWVTQ
jgi:hypothetical protein